MAVMKMPEKPSPPEMMLRSAGAVPPIVLFEVLSRDTTSVMDGHRGDQRATSGSGSTSRSPASVVNLSLMALTNTITADVLAGLLHLPY